jgi:hypothetical protein
MSYQGEHLLQYRDIKPKAKRYILDLIKIFLGMNQTVCDDPCCYPARISSYERWLNSSAVPCQWNTRNQCHLPPGLKYGFYLPWAVILIAIVIIGCILRRDWYGEKRLFSHITKHPVRILK